MMRIAVTAAAAAALLLPGCGPKTLTLPEQPIDRAATCGVVAAAAAREATPDIQQPLSFEAQGRILHYALLAGAQGETFSADIASQVSQRMSDLQEDITSGKWRELAPACAATFPATQKTEVTLAADAFDAELGCDELGDFIGTALMRQEVDYATELGEYRDLARKLDDALGVSLSRRVGANLQAQQEARSKALADIVKLGPPTAVMRQCIERFG